MEDLTGIDLASALLTVVHNDDIAIFWSDDDLDIIHEAACRLNDTENPA